MSIQLFDGNDDLYMDWLAANANGFVVNTRRARARQSSYMMLHRASCSFIKKSPWPDGGFTERGYIKVCAPTVDELRVWVKKHGREDGSFSNECGFCHPM